MGAIRLGTVMMVVGIGWSCASGTIETDADPRGNDADGGLGGRGGAKGSASSSTMSPAKSGDPTSVEINQTYSLDVTCSDLAIVGLCLLDATADKSVGFAIPAHMKKSSIRYTITPQGFHAGGSVTWASEDPHDGTIHIHGYADAFSSVHIEVTGVIAVAE